VVGSVGHFSLPQPVRMSNNAAMMQIVIFLDKSMLLIIFKIPKFMFAETNKSQIENFNIKISEATFVMI